MQDKISESIFQTNNIYTLFKKSDTFSGDFYSKIDIF